jgi:hypothetical protein
MNSNELCLALSNFTGSKGLYRHGLNRNVTYTQGVQYFAQHAGGGAYWLLDIFATEPDILKQQKEFASITLTVSDNERAEIVVDDGNGSPSVFKRQISWTTCPAGIWKFYMIDGTILLPSEY